MRKMKDSGIEWIGEIPEKWSIEALKRNVKIEMGQSPSSDCYNSDNVGFPFLQGNADFTDRFPIERVYTTEANKFSHTGDLLLSVRAPVGAINISDKEYAIGRGLCSITGGRISIPFLWYAMSILNKEFDANSTGSTFESINTEDVGNAKIMVPSAIEQTRIADYLDKKCAEIDAIIAAKEKTNELLKERRQSIIYEAVTKGLDPTVPMKDSGVEWIGEIPESWSVWRLKHLLCQEKGAIKAGPFGSSITANDMQGGDVKVFTQRTVLDNDFLSGDEYISFDKYEDLKGFSVKTGDILITTRGTIGKTAIVPKNSFGILHPCLIKMSIDSDKINKSLLCRIFNETNIFEEQLRLASNATTIDVIYTQNLLNIFVPLAPLHEQDRICKYLNEKCESLDYLISSNDSTIKKLKEYRQSVIYEAVTGKVEI